MFRSHSCMSVPCESPENVLSSMGMPHREHLVRNATPTTVLPTEVVHDYCSLCTSTSAVQVDVIRQIELGQAREEEAAKWRQAMTQQREELETLYSERMRRLRDMEEAAVARVQDLHHAAKRTALEMRQRMLGEDDRMRASLQVGCSS